MSEKRCQKSHHHKLEFQFCEIKRSRHKTAVSQICLRPCILLQWCCIDITVKWGNKLIKAVLTSLLLTVLNAGLWSSRDPQLHNLTQRGPQAHNDHLWQKQSANEKTEVTEELKPQWRKWISLGFKWPDTDN